MGTGSSSQSYTPQSSSDEERNKSDTRDAAIQTEKYQKPCFFRYVTLLTRLWGIVLFVGLWGCTVQGFREMEHKLATYYLLCVSILVTFFEVVWMINKCVCCHETSVCYKVWRAFVWVDDWKKTILYLLFAAPCFTKELGYVFAYLAAALLIVAAWFYFMKSFRDSACIMRRVEEGEATVKVVPPQSSESDTTHTKSRLVATEQKAYDSISPSRAQPQSSSPKREQPQSGASSEHVDQYATPEEDGKSSAFDTADENDTTPVGYKFDYGNGKTTATHVEPPAPKIEDGTQPGTNPFDYENVAVIQSPYVANDTSKQRATSTNPFDEESFEHEIETHVQPPKSKNPFN